MYVYMCVHVGAYLYVCGVHVWVGGAPVCVCVFVCVCVCECVM